MLDSVRLWAFSVCSAAIGGSVACMLAPPGKMEKVLRFTVTLFFLCCLLSPIAVGGFDLALGEVSFDLSDGAAADFSGAIDAQVESAFAQNIRMGVESLLWGKGYLAREIFISVHTDADGRIYILQIRIQFGKGADAPTPEQLPDLQNTVFDSYGVLPQIEYLGG